MPMVTVRYWAAAKHAAGVAEEKVSAETLSEALTAVLSRRHRGAARPAGGPVGESAPGGPPDGAQALRTVLTRSSFLVDGDPVGGRAPAAVPLREDAVIEVLPPFAGG
jgi:molybdopterin converting factor small subunit